MPNARWIGGFLGVLFGALLLTTGYAARGGEAEGRVYAVGEVLIRWRETTAIADATRARAALMAAWEGRRVDSVPALGIERWRVRPGHVAEVVQALRARPDVAWAEPNYLIRLLDTTSRLSLFLSEAFPFIHVSPRGLAGGGKARASNGLRGFLQPNDPYYRSYASRYLQRLGVETAWALEPGRPDVVVAVVDTGVDCAHEDLQGACWRNPGEIPNGVDDDRNGYVDDLTGWNFYAENPDPSDAFYHGTHVAGIIAARVNNGIGVAGVAPGVRLMPLAIFSPRGVGTYYDLIRALLYAVDNGAQVINLSLGATSYSYGEALAIRYAVRHGVVVVAAAGNRASDRVFYPAAHPEVIAVSATDASDGVAVFSNHGAYIDVAAPGVAVISTLPNNRYGVLSGTSMAAPHVSALAALLRSRNGRLTPAQIRQLIVAHAEDQVGPAGLGPPGKGPYYVYGRIHIGRTVAAVPAATSPSPPPAPGPQLPWTPPCQDVLTNGGFEAGLTGWQAARVLPVTSPVYEGARAVRLAADDAGHISQEVRLPAHALRATFFAAVRIETADSGEGPSPDMPFDDWMRITLAGAGHTRLLALMGNTSDSVLYGLAWDELLALLPAADVRPWRGRTVRLTLEVGGDRDNLPTTFTVDALRLCVVQGPPRAFLPWLPQND